MVINGQPIISYLIQRIKNEFFQETSGNHLEIFILTGEQKKNQKLVKLAEDYKISSYCGHNNNIPIRMNELVTNMDFDFIISVDGDDILCAPEGMRQVYNSIKKGNNFIKTTSYPFGMNSMGMSKMFLKNSLDNFKNIETRNVETGWGWVFDEDKCMLIDGGYPKDERLRFTLDYLDDFIFFNKIILSDFDITSVKTKIIIDHVIINRVYSENMYLNTEYWKNFNKQQSEEIKGTNNG